MSEYFPLAMGSYFIFLISVVSYMSCFREINTVAVRGKDYRESMSRGRDTNWEVLKSLVW